MENREECGCAILGKKRVLKRSDILQYRDWRWTRFMSTFQGSVLQELWKWALLYSSVAALWMTLFQYTKHNDNWNQVNLSTHKFLSVPIAFLIVFRANVAHDRFWEGKGHLEKFHGSLRTIAQKTLNLIEGDDDEAHALRCNICRMLPVLAVACKHDLRHTYKGRSPEENAIAFRQEINCWVTQEEGDLLLQTHHNRPVRVIGWLGSSIVKANRSGRMGGGDTTFAALDNETGRLFDTWMGMNKICFTPTPFPYIHCLHWFVCIYLMTLPAPLVPMIGWWSVAASSMLACAMYAIEEVAMEIEDPFGDDLNDLPIETLAPGVIIDFVDLNYTWSRPIVLTKDGLHLGTLPQLQRRVTE